VESTELDDEVYEKIKRYSANGDALAQDGLYSDAIQQYHQAWVLIPEPQNNWAAATWVLAAIGDALFLSGRIQDAREAFEYAMTCPAAIGNPFLHLRLGQTLYEAGALDQAADELIRAYMGAGEEIFSQDDPKYLQFLGTRADLT
jgi:tetratricopeptide (TPR) repeat protein